MLVVIANDREKQERIKELLEAEGERVALLSSLGELLDFLRKTPVRGILIDLLTSTRSSSQEKEETNDIIQLFPNAKVKVVKNDLLILGSGVSLKQFVDDCKRFKPRTIRKSARRVRHIAFLLSADASFENCEKVVTLNLSDGGCFVYSANEWKEDDRVWLRFIDNDRVMTAIVRWWQPWGNNKKMPGIGIMFE